MTTGGGITDRAAVIADLHADASALRTALTAIAAVEIEGMGGREGQARGPAGRVAHQMEAVEARLVGGAQDAVDLVPEGVTARQIDRPPFHADPSVPPLPCSDSPLG